MSVFSGVSARRSASSAITIVPMAPCSDTASRPMGIRDYPIAPRLPSQNPYAERMTGSILRARFHPGPNPPLAGQRLSDPSTHAGGQANRLHPASRRPTSPSSADVILGTQTRKSRVSAITALDATVIQSRTNRINFSVQTGLSLQGGAMLARFHRMSHWHIIQPLRLPQLVQIPDSRKGHKPLQLVD